MKHGYKENADIIRYRWLLRHHDAFKEQHPDIEFFGASKQELEHRLGNHIQRARDE